MRGGSEWKRTVDGTRVPTLILKLTFVTASTFSCLMADTIWVRFSAGGAAAAVVDPEAPAPVVEDLVSAAGALVSVAVAPVAGVLVAALGLASGFASLAALSGVALGAALSCACC